MTFYQEEQPMRLNWIARSAAGVMLAVAAWTFYLRWRMSAAPAIVDTAVLVPFCVSLALAVWLLTLRMRTEVRSDEVVVHYRPLWFPKRIPLNQILSAESVRYRPIRDYGGWGIRRGRAGWAWNVSGDRGVMLRLSDGKQFLIGSQQPEKLAAAIASARESARVSAS